MRAEPHSAFDERQRFGCAAEIEECESGRRVHVRVAGSKFDAFQRKRDCALGVATKHGNAAQQDLCVGEVGVKG
jgi:hypothetical protein